MDTARVRQMVFQSRGARRLEKPRGDIGPERAGSCAANPTFLSSSLTFRFFQQFSAPTRHQHPRGRRVADFTFVLTGLVAGGQHRRDLSRRS